MFADNVEVRGRGPQLMGGKSAETTFMQRGPKKNFITELDIIWKEEEPEPIPEPGKKAAPKKKAKEEELKLYPNHKYEFPGIGYNKKEKIDNLVKAQVNSEDPEIV